jgi:hypothetical protein
VRNSSKVVPHDGHEPGYIQESARVAPGGRLAGVELRHGESRRVRAALLTGLLERSLMADKHLMTEAEAKAVQGAMMANALVYIAIAVIAHFLVWNWRPWLG